MLLLLLCDRLYVPGVETIIVFFLKRHYARSGTILTLHVSEMLSFPSKGEEKGGCMKTIFQRNNRGKLTLSLLFALSWLSFVVLLVCQIAFHLNITGLALAGAFLGIVFFGSLLIQARNGPPW